MKYSVGRWQQAVAKKRKAESGKQKAEVGKHYVARLGDCTLLPAARCPLPTSRSGISLIEVLISIGVLALGLLGVAALFPVGSYYMLQAEVKDRSAAVAQQAFADLVDKGMLNPGAWVVDRSNNFKSSLTATHENYTQTDFGYRNASPNEKRQRVTHNFGYAFAIDPLAVASSLEAPPAPLQGARLGRFPLSLATDFRAMNAGAPSWRPFVFGGSNPQLPVRRLTFADPRGWLMNPPEVVPIGMRSSESLFQSLDDLANDLPEQNNLPGQTLWETTSINGNTQALARQPRGDYSWLATISPTTIDARDALFTNPTSYLYDVSVVVFYKRFLGDVFRMTESEAVVRGHVATTGTNGGEMVFNVESNITGTLNAVKNLKVGEYVMVTGPHPESSIEAPKLFLQWYRVLSIQDDTTFNDDNLPELRVALRGPDWPWKPVANLQDESQLSNDLRIGIFPGAVAVHTKTLRLGGGAGNGVGSGSPWDPPGGDPPGFPPPPYVLY